MKIVFLFALINGSTLVIVFQVHVQTPVNKLKLNLLEIF